jgi:hypothetical protein
VDVVPPRGRGRPSVSDVAAAAEIRAAVRLTTVLPTMLALLEAGGTTVQRAREFVTELEVHDDELAGLVDAAAAERCAGLPVWRIRQEVRRAAAKLDPEAAAQRTAQKNAGRRVELQPEADDQASLYFQGPAVPVTRLYDTLGARARALKQAGDPRTLAQLRFDLATSTFPCASHTPADPTAPISAPTVAAAESRPDSGGTADAAPAGESAPAGAPGLRPGFVEAAAAGCRMSRPVQASITVPVETSLGLSNEPGWLDGYGWLSAPTCRQLLVDAELRRVCTRSGTGELVDLADRDVRPPPTPTGVREALLDMVLDPIQTSDLASRTEAQHDPSEPLRELVALRDRCCDGPTGSRVPASRCDLDHDTPYPHGPTAAWNLRARSQRTHQLKHSGWTPLQTPTATIWFSPAGQVIEVPHLTEAPPGVDHDPHQPAALPDADELAALDRHQTDQPDVLPHRPWLPPQERTDTNGWVWIEDDPPF